MTISGLIERIFPRHFLFRLSSIASARFMITWFPRRLSVGWLLCGDENVGSSRIHGLNLHRYLRTQGVNSFVISRPSCYAEALEIDAFSEKAILGCDFDVVIMQRVHLGQARRLVDSLKKRGTLTIFFAADLFDSEAYHYCDYVFTSSQSLKAALIERGIAADRIHAVNDAIETPRALCKSYRNPSSLPIKLVWVGAAGHWGALNELRYLLEHDSRLSCFKLVSISNHPCADMAWNLDSVWSEILECDIGVIPVNLELPASIVKSNNRATMFKALGLPVICSRLPAYEDVIDSGVTGFIVHNPSEWANSLLELSAADRREEIGLAGRELVFEKYGIDRVGEDFQCLLRILTRKDSPVKT